MYFPSVIEKENMTEKTYDVISRMLKDRVIFLNGEIDTDNSASIVAQLLFLEAQNNEEEICMYINSPGGVITAGMAIYDTMNYISCDVKTICIGQACSMGALLLTAGTKGKRISLPNSTIMIHQPLGGASEQATEIEIQANEILRLKKHLNEIMSKKTYGKVTYKEMVKLTDRDNYLSPEKALEYGIIDKIITNRN